jgi:hypothetical protein
MRRISCWPISRRAPIVGRLEVQGESINFNNGRGYIEKDWGRSFPSAYVWMQSNHFGKPGISLKCSVAKVPWLGASFVGFIAGIWMNNRLIKFTTYNKSALRKLSIASDSVELLFENKNHSLEILVDPATVFTEHKGRMGLVHMDIVNEKMHWAGTIQDRKSLPVGNYHSGGGLWLRKIK